MDDICRHPAPSAAGDPVPDLTMICYASKAIPGFDQGRLRVLLQRSRDFNMAADITGCLVFDARHIVVQVLEGRPGPVQALFERIEADPRHEEVTMLWTGSTHRREFPRHPMACYNLAWRRMHGLREPQAAVDELLAAPSVKRGDIVALAEQFRLLRLPRWAETAAA